MHHRSFFNPLRNWLLLLRGQKEKVDALPHLRLLRPLQKMMRCCWLHLHHQAWLLLRHLALPVSHPSVSILPIVLLKI
jgi:hypothetical protein